MQQELTAKQVPAGGGRAARTGVKRAAEPETVLRTTRRRAAPAAAQPAALPSEPAAEASEPVPEAPTRRGRGKAAAEAAPGALAALDGTA